MTTASNFFNAAVVGGALALGTVPAKAALLSADPDGLTLSAAGFTFTSHSPWLFGPITIQDSGFNTAAQPFTVPGSGNVVLHASTGNLDFFFSDTQIKIVNQTGPDVFTPGGGPYVYDISLDSVPLNTVFTPEAGNPFSWNCLNDGHCEVSIFNQTVGDHVGAATAIWNLTLSSTTQVAEPAALGLLGVGALGLLASRRRRGTTTETTTASRPEGVAAGGKPAPALIPGGATA